MFLPTFNGVTCIPHDAPAFHVLTDSSTVGASITCHHDWLYVNWALDLPDVADCHINEKELMAVVLAACRWAPLWQGWSVLLHMDNMMTKTWLNKVSTNNPRGMHWLQYLFWFSVTYDFRLEAIHVPGCYYHLPNALSRLHQTCQALWAMALLLDDCRLLPCSHMFWPIHISYNSFLFLFRRFYQDSPRARTG